MCYDSPKAVHFVARQNGRQMPYDSEIGLRLRWHAARACRLAGVSNMLQASDREKAATVCDGLNASRSQFTVDLRPELDS